LNAYNDVKLFSRFGFSVGKRLENFDRIVTDRRQEHCQPGGIRFLVSADRDRKNNEISFRMTSIQPRDLNYRAVTVLVDEKIPCFSKLDDKSQTLLDGSRLETVTRL